jgi:hypothetical protein
LFDVQSSTIQEELVDIYLVIHAGSEMTLNEKNTCCNEGPIWIQRAGKKRIDG